MKLKLPLLAAFCVLITFVQAQNWTGNVDTDWNNSANWSSWPLTGQDITIDPALLTGAQELPIINANSSFSPANIIVQNGAVLTISANLTIQENMEVLGTGSLVLQDAGQLQVGPGNGGRLILDLGGFYVITAGRLVVEERLIVGSQSVIQVDDGTVTSNERFILDLGGTAVQNGGVVTVAQTLALADGDINSNSTYVIEAGTLNVNGELALENESGVFEPTFLMLGGTLNLNGDLSWLGVAPGAGTPLFLVEGGKVNANGNVANLPGSTVNMYLEVSGKGIFTQNGGNMALIHATDSVVLYDSARFVVQNNWTCNNEGVFHAFDGTFESNGIATLNGNGRFQLADINILTSASFMNQAVNGLSISRNIDNNGAFLDYTHVTLNGEKQQEIKGTVNTDFNTLQVNKSKGDILFQRDLTIYNHLELVSGVMLTKNDRILMLVDNATSSAGNDSSYVQGKVRKMGDDAFVFPLGSNGKWRRFAISAPTNAGAYVTVNYVDQAHSGSALYTAPLRAVSPVEHWNVEGVLSGALDVKLFWEYAQHSGITDCPDFTIAAWDNASWIQVNSLPSGTCSGNGKGSITTAVASTLSRAYTFGYLSNTTTQYFELCEGDSVEIGGQYQQQKGTYVQQLKDINNQDSTVISYLHVNLAQRDSLFFEICHGEEILIAGKYYNQTGVFMDTLLSTNGCDSILKIQINKLPALDTTVMLNGTTLTAAMGFSSYRWLDCNNGYAPIPGETSFQFTPTVNGAYAVRVTDGTCADTGSCYPVQVVGRSVQPKQQLQLYPNPADNMLEISLPGVTAEVISIMDRSGRVVLECPVDFTNGKAILRFEQQPLQPGYYLLQLNTGQDSYCGSFVKY